MSETTARHQAILVAPGEYPKMDSLQQRLPAELHLVGDRSWLQRQLETCVDGGVQQRWSAGSQEELLQNRLAAAVAHLWAMAAPSCQWDSWC